MPFRALLLALFGFVCAPLAHAQAFALLSPAEVQRVSTQAATAEAQTILHNADAALTQEPHPMPRLHTEGTLEHQGIRDQSVAAERDFGTVLDLAFAYRLTSDKRYLAQTQKYLDAWFGVYVVSGNPIDETVFDPIFMAFDLTRSELPAATQKSGVELFRSMATTYLDWLDANYAKDPYNWSSHRVKLAVLGAYETGDAALIERASHAFTRHVRQNIRADGSVNDFYKRDALHYVVYSLEPLSMCAIAAKAHGLDWFHTSAFGSPSIQMGVDWLIPYAYGEKTHMEFVHSVEPFDAARDKAGEKGYSGQWEPRNSVGLFTMAAWLDPKYAPVLDKVKASTDGRVRPSTVLAMRVSQ